MFAIEVAMGNAPSCRQRRTLPDVLFAVEMFGNKPCSMKIQ